MAGGEADWGRRVMKANHSAPETCRRCGGVISFIGTSGADRTAATSYATCLYECESCRTRYSNARDPQQRTAFAAQPRDNVPLEIGGGLAKVLDGAINDANRRNKREKFCAETSEDAVTWTVFRWLHQGGHSALVPSLCGLARPKSASSLLLWGAPAGGEEAEQVRQRYEQVSDALGEKPRRRTEIDVLLVWDDLIAAVEVKYRSPNDRKSGRADRLERYVQPRLFAAEVESVNELGFYELARNWTLGSALAEALDRRFLLVNLGPERLRADVDMFRAQLRESDARRAAFLSWVELADGFQSLRSVPDWIEAYMEARGL